jgi:hypothetical protein
MRALLIIGLLAVIPLRAQDGTAQKNQKETDKSPSPTIAIVSEPAPQQEEGSPASQPKHSRFDWFWSPLIANWPLVVIGGLGVWAALKTLAAIKRELVLTQRPRITVRNFYFSKMKGTGAIYSVPSGIEVGSVCSGQFYIANSGGSRACIQEIDCRVWVDEEDGPLPAKRPYEGEMGMQEKKVLLSGQSIPYLFSRANPLQFNTPTRLGFKSANLYVLGWIGYTDDLGIYRRMGFCRRYDTSKDRFLPVDDADYEYED